MDLKFYILMIFGKPLHYGHHDLEEVYDYIDFRNRLTIYFNERVEFRLTNINGNYIKGSAHNKKEIEALRHLFENYKGEISHDDC